MILQCCLAVSNLRKINSLKILRRIMSSESLCCEAKAIFKSSIKSVQTEKLIHKSVKVHMNSVEIQGKHFSLHKNVYIVGFGKAVLGMAVALEDLLQDHLISGILSLPVGYHPSRITETKRFLTKIQIFEGACNNIPDEDSFLAAQKIAELVASLQKSNLLFVLISGGGSALLPYPKSPITLEEKQNVIKILASKGATIEELNVVRKRLSKLKGGGLANLAKPAEVISLILSDVIGDPLGIIASGPTIENTDDSSLPLTIIAKYNVTDELPQTAVKLLKAISNSKSNIESFNSINNFIIGNNTAALQGAADKAEELQYNPLVMTNKLCGIASDVGSKIVQLVDFALQQDYDKILNICKELNIQDHKADCLLNQMQNIDLKYKGLCMLFGGETTVNVKGKGIGGRNQELALAASLALHSKKYENEIVLLSAGTDGIDGPTDAAGAIATPSIISTINKLDALSCLNENDSYNFYNSQNNGQFHVKIGHTGTNAMDVIIVLIKWCF